MHPSENAQAVAVAPIKRLADHLPVSGGTPLFIFDAGYDSAPVTQGVGEVPVAVRVCLRADRCFYADPPSAPPSPKGGRPRIHGAKFAGKDPATWPSPTAEHVTQDEQYGTAGPRLDRVASQTASSP